MIPNFRAWDKVDKVIREVTAIDWSLDLVEFMHGAIERSFDDVILMQSTGLKDKNGVEIFEGYVGWDDHLEVNGKVIYDEGKFIYEWENICDDLCEVNADIDVIGNIYENPELLEVEG